MIGKYMTDAPVHYFYFDWETAELKHKVFDVVGYDYMDGPQWNVIDEYKLVEYYYEKKWFFFKKKKIKTYRIKGHLLSNNIEEAKTKFLYYFLEGFGNSREEFVSPSVLKMVKTAKTMYAELMDKYPEVVYRAITEKLSEDGADSFWR